MKKALLISLSALFAVGAVVVFQLITEKYYFDKVYYHKSAIYGYGHTHNDIAGDGDNFLVTQRMRDSIDLVNLENKESVILNQSVLGITTEEASSGPDPIYRIAVIGDSFVFGIGVKTDERFSSVLEKKLNKYYPTKVYNLSYPGNNIINYYTLFSHAKEKLNIDLFIVSVVEDDLLYMEENRRYPGEDYFYERFRLECPGEVYNYQPEREQPWDEVIIEGIYPSFSDEYANICILTNIASEMIENNTIFINLNAGPVSKSFEEGLPEHVNKKNVTLKKYADTIRKEGGDVIDPFDNPEYVFSTVSEKEGHSSKSTHAAQAELLFEKIMNDPAYGFPSNN